jgi:hypothetical protein
MPDSSTTKSKKKQQKISCRQSRPDANVPDEDYELAILLHSGAQPLALLKICCIIFFTSSLPCCSLFLIICILQLTPVINQVPNQKDNITRIIWHYILEAGLVSGFPDSPNIGARVAEPGLEQAPGQKKIKCKSS